MKRATLLCVACMMLPCMAEEDVSAAHTVEHALASFELADETLVIELVAAEPHVIDPVAIAFDERGRMYVAEMRDYPEGPIGGTIRVLDDLDADGRFETAHIFAEGLAFPNSVLPWRGGLLVSAAPDILFLKDTDDDNRADERRTILTGFAEGNEQLRVNSLYFGLDNWVYAANGRSDGTVRRPDQPADQAMPLQRHDLRFNPDTGAHERIAGFSQFGLCEDDWGNRFLSWNTVPIRHAVMEEKYLLRNPLLAITNLEHIVTDPKDTGRLYPRIPPQQRYNRESVEFFNASCGLHVYRGDAIPDFARQAFVCEPLTSLVHRRRLEATGATFASYRVDNGSEFLASTDSWFKPVNVTTGPDGNLYVVDFAREWVEHPDFVPEEFRDKIDWRNGDDLGRIWRIRKKDIPLPSVTTLDPSNPSSLISSLAHQNGWVRVTAQRLLHERGKQDVVPQLELTSREGDAKAQVHALYTLHGLQALKPEHITPALEDSSSHVRHTALALAAQWLEEQRESRVSTGFDFKGTETWGPLLLQLAEDPDARVRVLLAQTIGELDDVVAKAVRLHLISSAGNDSWERLAILIGLRDKAPEAFEELWAQKQTFTAGTLLLQGAIAELIGASRDSAAVARALQTIAGQSPEPAHLAAITGLAKGMNRSGGSIATALDSTPEFADLRQSLDRVIVRTIKDNSLAPELRIEAVSLIQMGLAPDAALELPALIQGDNPEPLRIAAINALVASGHIAPLRSFFKEWSSLPITTRRAIIQGTIATAPTAIALLDAIDARELEARELDAQVRETLVRYPDETIRTRAEALFAKETRVARAEVVQQYVPALDLQGDGKSGAVIFKDNCLPCHRVRDLGNRVGPDLSGIASRSREKLLSDILDPNAEVSPDYVAYTAVTSELDVITGVLAGETEANLTFRQALGVEQTVPREILTELRASMMSMMPEGFEAGIGIQGMADLLEFLHNPGEALE